MAKRKVRDTCKRRSCKQRIPLLVVLAGDPYCSAECCRADHGATQRFSATLEYPHEPRYQVNSGAIGAYAQPSSGAPTRRQLEAASRDVVARERLGLKAFADYSPKFSLNKRKAA